MGQSMDHYICRDSANCCSIIQRQTYNRKSDLKLGKGEYYLNSSIVGDFFYWRSKENTVVFTNRVTEFGGCDIKFSPKMEK